MKLASIGLLFFALILVHPNSLEAKKQAQGVFTVVKGKVTILRAGKSKERKVRVGTKVYPQDTITADKDSRAKVVMTDKNILNISPESKIAIEAYENDPANKKKKVMLNLVYGKLRSTVNQKYDEKKNVYRVKTPSAVAGVRGTDFIVNHDIASKQSEITTFEGQVQVGSGITPNGGIANPVFVNPGQSTTAAFQRPPVKPFQVPKNKLAQLDKSSNADVASTDSNDSNRNPANDSSKNEDGNKEKSDEPSNNDKSDSKKEQNSDQQSSDKKSSNESSNNQANNNQNKEQAKESGSKSSRSGGKIAGTSGDTKNSGATAGSSLAGEPNTTDSSNSRDPSSVKDAALSPDASSGGKSGGSFGLMPPPAEFETIPDEPFSGDPSGGVSGVEGIDSVINDPNVINDFMDSDTINRAIQQSKIIVIINDD